MLVLLWLREGRWVGDAVWDSRLEALMEAGEAMLREPSWGGCSPRRWRRWQFHLHLTAAMSPPGRGSAQPRPMQSLQYSSSV